MRVIAFLIECTVTAVIVVAIFSLMIVGLMVGADRQEIVECRQWDQQAHEFKMFYLVSWQKEQCDAHNIYINAPVK